MRIDEFSKGIRGLIYGKPNEYSLKIVNNLKSGRQSYTFHVKRNGGIHVFNADLEGIFKVLSRIKMYTDYTYEARVNKNGEIKEIRVKYPIDTPISNARKDVGGDILNERVITDDFEIIKINKEIIVKSDNDQNYFNLICGLFPYFEINDNVKDYKVEVLFEVTPTNRWREEKKNQGKLIVYVFINGVKSAAKSAIFKF